MRQKALSEVTPSRKNRGEGASPGTQPGASAGRRKRGCLGRLAIAAVSLVVVLLVLTSVNFVMEGRERSQITPYGERVPVAGGAMNVWTNGRQGRPTIVLLSGLGTAAPALDFAPLIRQLDGYNIVVVEGFGYGYSDLKARPRTIENITAELHEVLSRINVEQPYVLAGHSIAGLYMLSYSDRYPDEVSAVIGIDPTVPAAKEDIPQPTGRSTNWLRLLTTSGIVRAVIALAPVIAEPDGDDYAASELERIRRMTVWNYFNDAVADETARIGSNAAALRGVKYPDELPVLHMLASDGASDTAQRVQLHEDLLRNVRRHEVVVLDGAHYLHWTQSEAMAQKITDFLEME